MGTFGLREPHQTSQHPRDGLLVQFYENEQYLASSLAEFIHRGLSENEAALVIATRPHWEAALQILSHDSARGLAVVDALRENSLRFSDAEAFLLETASGIPDRKTFENVLEPLLRTERPKIRIFAELVNILCNQDRPRDALLIEQYWNSVLARNPHASLTCGFSVSNLQLSRTEAACKGCHYTAPSADSADPNFFGLRELEKELRGLEEEVQRASKLSLLGELCGRLAHEINNPLAVIRCSKEAADHALGKLKANAENGEAVEKVKKFLAHIDSATTRMADLMKSVLDFSHQSVSKRRIFNLRPQLEEALRQFSAQGDSQGIELDLKSSSPEIFCLGDPDLLQVVWKNVLRNARDSVREAHGPAGGQIRVEIGLSPGAGPFVTIADNGSGVRAQDLPKVFLPFFSTKPTGKGTGLGLSIAHGIVRQHEGEITLDSKPGEGATLRVGFPAIYVFR